MANLLPENKKKELQWDYVLKLAGVVFVFLCGALVFAVVALLPSYFTTTLKAQTIQEDLKRAENVPSGKESDDVSIARIKEVNTFSLVLETWFAKPSAYQTIAAAVIEKIDGVAITSITYNRQNGKVVLSGVAKKRDDLIALKNILVKNVSFKNVELPVSDLAHKENLSFAITIALAQP